MLGSRTRTIGPLTVFYDQPGSRPRRVRFPDEHGALSDDLLLTLFLVLLHV